MLDAAIFSSQPHIVDRLIAERAPAILARPGTRRLFMRWLAGPLRYAEARRMADEVGGLPGFEIMERVSRELALEVSDSGLARVPASGPCIVVANHPTGLADGICVFDSLRRRRPDMRFLVNRDAMRVAPGLIDVMIPIELVRARQSRAASREALRLVDDAVARGQVLVVFPSGRLAHLTPMGLRERVWLPGVLGIARRHGLPIVPLHIQGRNSPAFYAFSLLSRELRDVTLFRELLNKRRRSFRLSYGEPLSASDLPADPQLAVAWLQHHVERLLPMREQGRDWDRLATPQPTLHHGA